MRENPSCSICYRHDLQDLSEAGQLDATDLTPDSLTWLSWRWGHLGTKMSY